MATSLKRDSKRMNITQEEISCQICGRGHTVSTCRQLNRISQQNQTGPNQNYS